MKKNNHLQSLTPNPFERKIRQAVKLEQLNISPTKPYLQLLIGFCLLIILPDIALANPFDDKLTKLLGVIQGPVATSFAVIAVIGLGFAALSGRLSMKWGIMIVLGIALIFGATELVTMFTT